MSDMSCVRDSSTCSVAESARIIEQMQDGMAAPPGWQQTMTFEQFSAAAGAGRQLGSSQLGRRASPGWRSCAGSVDGVGPLAPRAGNLPHRPPLLLGRHRAARSRAAIRRHDVDNPRPGHDAAATARSEGSLSMPMPQWIDEQPHIVVGGVYFLSLLLARTSSG